MSWQFQKGTTHVCKSQGTRDKSLNPINGYGGNKTPDVNPKCVGMERYCSKDSKNVLVVEIGLVKAVLQMIESFWWVGRWST